LIFTAMFDVKWRGKAAGLHLAGSGLVAALAAALVFLLWYPGAFALMAGGVGLFALLVSVDVVMGPLITFAVFDRRKPRAELRRDLVIVIALQLAALGYGLYVMHAARPVVLALESNRFRVVPANDVLVEELPAAVPAFQSLPLWGPVTVRTVAPSDPSAQFDAITRALAGADLGHRPQYWRPWDEAAREQTRAAARPLAEIRQRYADRAGELDAAIGRTGRAEQALRYLPVLTRYSDWIALIDAASGDVVGFAPFNAY
jgi:hypothetical protein